MAITKLEIKSFTVFEDISFDFEKGANIFIGVNGTGKTQLLKLMYFFTRNLEEDFGKDEFEKIFMAKPSQMIRNRKDNEKTKFSCMIDGAEEVLEAYDIYSQDGVLPIFGGKVKPKKDKINAVFIPAKEMLSHSKGFLAINEKFKIPFDKTLVDIIVNAELPEARKNSDLDRELLELLGEVIGGEVIYENDTFYIKKNDGPHIEFPLEAEGLRKIGLLWKLIRNGLIDENTILFWDEPEANLNPQLIPVLVEALFKLQRSGVQLFLATHDYNLARYFEVKGGAQDKILYHCLYKTEQGVISRSYTSYKDIEDNPIEMANEQLYEDILNKSVEDLENE